MIYKVVVTDRAHEHIDNIIRYIIEQLKNDVAAVSILEDIESTFDRLENIARSLQLCNDPYLAEKGYRKISLGKHDYLMLYQIKGNVVFVNGIFHMLEDYHNKL
jgi:plasmid stabilization system protein ParE